VNIRNERANFEQEIDQKEYERGSYAAQITLELGEVASRFSRIERVPRYADGERENDSEHSFMLALVAPELIDALELDLDASLATQFAIVHDLVELKTGDIPTLVITEDRKLQKEIDEQIAIRELACTLPPHTMRMLVRYEQQVEPEARFVRYVDKLLPIVLDVIGSGGRVMREDYNITAPQQLRACQRELHDRIIRTFGNEFPELDLAHELLCELFEMRFSEEMEIGLA